MYSFFSEECFQPSKKALDQLIEDNNTTVGAHQNAKATSRGIIKLGFTSRIRFERLIFWENHFV